MHDETLQRLKDIFPDAKLDEPMRRYTAWKIGGPADALLEPKDSNELVEAINKARENGVPVTILGGGTNVLIRDKGIRGLTIRLAKSMKNIEFDGELMTADAGALYPVLANTSAARGLAGMEFATGIPGTVGGAVFMNAGAYGTETKEVLIWAEVFRDGEIVKMTGEDLELSYRHSVLHDRPEWTVIRASYQLRPGDSEESKRKVKEFRSQRMTGSPSKPSCGSTFKRPPGDFPGRVIEAAGLKGRRVGNIEVSPVHANYFVNLGGGSSEDALELMEIVKLAVKDKLGVELEPEVRVVGEA